MKIYLPWLSSLLIIVIFSSCRNENATPIRNVRFDPGLLNPAHAGGGAPCMAYSFYSGSQHSSLGNVYSRMVLVSFSEGYTYEQAAAAVAGYGFVEKLGQAVSSNSARLYPVKLTEGLNCKQVEQAISELQKDAAISYVAPYFMAASQLLGVSNEFRVTIGDRQQGEFVLRRLANATRTEIVTAVSDDTYILRADKGSKGNALEMANFFRENPLVKHAQPDFLISQEM